jgi:hypothetical protein
MSTGLRTPYIAWNSLGNERLGGGAWETFIFGDLGDGGRGLLRNVQKKKRLMIPKLRRRAQSTC